MSEKPIWTETGKWKPPEWATYCAIRKPEFKVHSSLGLAHSAIANKKPHYEVTLLHFEDGHWRVEWEYTHPEACERCAGPFTRSPYGGQPYERYLPFMSEDRVKDAPVICKSCRDADRDEYYREAREAQEKAELARLQEKYGS